MSATWTVVNDGEYRGRGYWTCSGCKAEFTAEALPPVLRYALRNRRRLGCHRPLCAHCAERPPAEGEVDITLRGRVVAWEP